jgi:hypothetical protein
MALEEILRRQPVWRGALSRAEIPAVSTGYPALDEQLPGRGWPAGALTELLTDAQGAGEVQLLAPSLGPLSWAGKRIVWLAPPHLPYAPALAAAGIDLAQLAIVHASARRDALWAAEQVLRAHCCHALVAWFRHVRYDELRRLAVAAEGGPAWVAIFRPREAFAESSPAALRVALEPQADALCVHILKRRGPPAPAPLRLPLNRPRHALGRAPFPEPAAARAHPDRRLGLPVHA